MSSHHHKGPVEEQDQAGPGSAREWPRGSGADLAEDEVMLDEVPSDGPLLNRDEIDSLLSANAADDPGRKSGLAALLENATVSYERLPMLEVVFDRLVRIMTTSMRNFTNENVEVSLHQIDSLRFSDYLSSVPLTALISVFRAVEWDNYGLITADSPLIYSAVDVLLGGRRGTAPMRVEGRPYTTIERSLVQRLIQLVLADMAQAFEPLSRVEFRFERLETNPRFAAIARPTNAAILFKLRVEMEDRGGNLEVLIPYATLEPVRDLLLQMFLGEKFGHDSIWENHLAKEMLATQVQLEALLDEQMIPLGMVMDLAVGDTLPLTIRVNQPVVLRCGQVPLIRGWLGRRGDRIAIKVEERIDREGDR